MNIEWKLLSRSGSSAAPAVGGKKLTGLAPQDKPMAPIAKEKV
jgi:hypothetical protein